MVGRCYLDIFLLMFSRKFHEISKKSCSKIARFHHNNQKWHSGRGVMYPLETWQPMLNYSFTIADIYFVPSKDYIVIFKWIIDCVGHSRILTLNMTCLDALLDG